jgi:DNA-binding NarL/FixJ family response regulator
MLAHTMGDRKLAIEHYQRGASMNRAMGAWPALASTQARLARFLLESESEPERATGRQLMIDAEHLAERLGMTGLVADIRAALDEDAIQLPDGLSPREVEVLKLLAIGRSNKDIAKVLSISLSTVATHVRSILIKSGSANRTEAAAYAMRHQLT